MDKLKTLYKAGPKAITTLSERVKANKNRRQTARFDKYAAGRNLPVNESPGIPLRQPNQAVSKIADQNQKLKAYRLQRNTQKLKEILDKRSPFVVTVPVGRWLEKKEPAPKFRIGINDTPVRHALMTERVLKRSTVKKLVQSTLKKQNVMVFGKEASKPVAVKSKKRILGELNAVQTTVSQRPEKLEEELERVDTDLNTTFEITPDQDENKEESNPRKLLRRSNSVPVIAPILKVTGQKMLTPPAKGAIKKMMPKYKAAIVKPVIRPATAPVKAVAQVKSIAPSKRLMKQTVTIKSVPKQPEVHVITQEPESELIDAPIAVAKAIERPTLKKQPVRSSTYNLYKSSLTIQTSYLTMNISGIIQNKDMFFELLSEEQQTFVNQTVQQGNLIVSDKLGKFQEFLDQFEAGLSQPDNPKRITSDDVENYWYLIFEEIETLKSNLNKTQEIKKGALTTVGSERKRRTRRTYIPEDGTPRRSRRIADIRIGDTPKHNPSCYGCVTVSTTKINTPQSVHKRRTTVKKSVLFENVAETPKRKEGRRSTKLHVATPKRSLHRMNAIDVELDENDMELADVL